jgi:hypothetical protein
MWIHVTQYRGQWRAVVNMVMVSMIGGEFLD